MPGIATSAHIKKGARTDEDRTMDPLWDKFLREWHVIKQAPMSFGVAVAVAVLVIWGVFSWNYSGRLETKEATIEYQRTLIDDYRQKLQGASPDQAAGKIENLEREVAALKKEATATAGRLKSSQGPWRLTPEERDKLKAALTGEGVFPFAILPIPSNPQAVSFAEDLLGLFNKAGWPAALHYQNYVPTNVVGLHVSVAPGTDRQKYPAKAFAMESILGRAQIKFERGEDVLIKPGEVALVVGWPSDQ